ncbi:AfsR/SARP family transcriptional regulator [Actinoplanes solisilvae]|uniref:AfsR/SARP family transcriptional regulator n=1 Tax=Actinoplanes solisilvae TaxID=2486853 RepID=UPI000FD983F9|nr:BTAD domain-containing putative transcriptional regulator [Actinoplanes solisilvae]
MTEQTWFGLLGPLVVERDGQEVTIGADQERLLLAVLLIHANQVVSVDELIEWLWPDGSPHNPRATLQNYVWRLRKKVGGGLVTRPQGYLLTTDQRDLDRFRSLVAEAKTASAGEAARRLRAALDLRRGPILTDIRHDVLQRDLVPPLTDEVLAALSSRVDADLEAGRHTQVVPELRALTAEHPLREGFWAQLMLALYRDGQQSEALTTYRRLSRMLADELGIDPGPAARRLHEAILVSDPSLGTTTSAHPAVEAEWTVHRQLPLDLPGFVGRTEPAARVIARLADAGSTMPIVALTGLAGVGKTAFGVRVAHAVAGHFPDGQWYVQLGGGSAPKDVGGVLGELLLASGLGDAQVPPSPAARSAALRSRLAGRRVLLVLDDAADVEHVLPLLPGGPGCAVLVTSREDLIGLAVRFGALCLTLDVLDVDEASSLMTEIIGEREPGAVAELVELCGRLPLALRIAGADIAARGSGVEPYLDSLRDAGRRLARLAVPGDRRVGVRAAFDLSYVTLADAERHLFRLLGLVPGQDVDVSAAAALAGCDPADAERLLHRLDTAHLVRQYRPGRYQQHDLIKLYAAELAEPETARLGRLLDFYVASSTNAAGQINPALSGGTDEDVPDVAHATKFSDRDTAWSWLDQERENLIAAVDAGAIRLATVLVGYFYFGSHGQELKRVAAAGLRAARASQDREQEVRMLRFLADGHAVCGEREPAADYAEQAAALARALGDEAEEARVLIGLGEDYVELGRAQDAVEVLTRAAELSRRTGVLAVNANAISNLGNAYELVGRTDEAIHCYLRTIAAAEELDLTEGVLFGLLDLGGAHWHAGRLAEAAEALERCLVLAKRVVYRRPETSAHLTLARVYASAGRDDTARLHADTAFALATTIGATDLLAGAHVEFGSAALRAKKHGEAVEQYTRALHLAAGGVSRRYEAAARIGLADTYVTVGRLDAAREHLTQGAVAASALPALAALCLTVEARILAAEGRTDEAIETARRALTAHERCGFRIGEDLTRSLLEDLTRAMRE